MNLKRMAVFGYLTKYSLSESVGFRQYLAVNDRDSFWHLTFVHGYRIGFYRGKESKFLN